MVSQEKKFKVREAESTKRERERKKNFKCEKNEREKESVRGMIYLCVCLRGIFVRQQI